MAILVEKRDGTTEDWSFDKLLTAIAKAGIPIQDAEKIATNIQIWAQGVAANGKIESTKIRDQVIESLRPQFPVEAQNYETYKKE